MPIPFLEHKHEHELLSISEAARFLGIGRNNITDLINSKKIPIVKLPGYSRAKIHLIDLISLIEDNKFIHS